MHAFTRCMAACTAGGRRLADLLRSRRGGCVLAAHRCGGAASPVCAALAAADVTVEATVESNDVVFDQPFIFTIAVDGAQNVSPPSLVRDRRLRRRAISARRRRSRSSTAGCRRDQPPLPVDAAARRRQFTLGPFAVDVQGQRYETKPMPSASRGRAGAERAAQAAPSRQAATQGAAPGGRAGARREVYVGERVGSDASTLYIGNVRVRDLQYPGHRRRRRHGREVLASPTRATSVRRRTALSHRDAAHDDDAGAARPDRSQRHHDDERR